MEINNFSDLTQFIYDEYLKITENFGIAKASDDMIDFVEKSLKKYVKLFDKPLYRQTKRELQLQEAINTMPHGCIWKFFHPELWHKIQETLGQKEKQDLLTSDVPPETTLFPEIVKQPSVPKVSDDE